MDRPNKIFRTTYTVTILSEDPLGDQPLNELLEDMTDGDCIGLVEQTNEEVLRGKAAIQAALIAVNNDGSFFGDEDPEDSDDHG